MIIFIYIYVLFVLPFSSTPTRVRRKVCAWFWACSSGRKNIQFAQRQFSDIRRGSAILAGDLPCSTPRKQIDWLDAARRMQTNPRGSWRATPLSPKMPKSATFSPPSSYFLPVCDAFLRGEATITLPVLQWIGSWWATPANERLH